MRYLSARFSLAALLIIALMSGATAMPLWSQSSGLNSNGSETTLSAWESLQRRFLNELTGLQNDLSQALNDTKTSKLSLQKLTGLYETSLQRTAALEGYNRQMAERMQKRDEELYAAYETIDELEKRVHRKDNTILSLVLACVCLSGVIVAFIGVAVAKGYVRLPFRA